MRQSPVNFSTTYLSRMTVFPAPRSQYTRSKGLQFGMRQRTWVQTSTVSVCAREADGAPGSVSDGAPGSVSDGGPKSVDHLAARLYIGFHQDGRRPEETR